jgi:hypothetical protein
MKLIPFDASGVGNIFKILNLVFLGVDEVGHAAGQARERSFRVDQRQKGYHSRTRVVFPGAKIAIAGIDSICVTSP